MFACVRKHMHNARKCTTVTLRKSAGMCLYTLDGGATAAAAAAIAIVVLALLLFATDFVVR